MEILLPDVQRLQAETGLAINEQRLRAIVAERRVAELEAQVAALQLQKENPNVEPEEAKTEWAGHTRPT